MPYTNLQQLTDRFGERMLIQLTDRSSPPADAIDEAVVARAIGDTDAVIDGYLAGRYKLPLSQTPPLLGDVAQAIAIYKLHGYAPDPKIKDDYDQALKTLREISTGVVRLPAEGAEPEATSGSGVVTNDRDRPFTPDNLRGFV